MPAPVDAWGIEMVQRVEVVTSVERRRRFSDDQKMMIVEEASMPGASVSAIARKHEISPSMIFNWRKKMLANSAPVGSPRDESKALSLEKDLAEKLAEIRREIASYRQVTGNPRAHTPKAVKVLVREALNTGASARLIARETGLSGAAVGRCRTDMADLPAVRELKVLTDRTSPPLEAIARSVSIKVGTMATIELPMDALNVNLLRALIAAGQGHGGAS